MTGSVAVVDVGKTNVKLMVFDGSGKALAERSQVNAPLKPDARWPYLRMDVDHAWAFLLTALNELGASLDIEAIAITAHGAAGVLVNADGVALPPIDYEFDGFAAIDQEYDALRPPFEETFSPGLPRGLNLGRQIFYCERTFPADFARATAFLAHPQYWAWRLSGVMASEVTSLAAHSDLWRPSEGRFSSLVERCGWSRLFPQLRHAWDTLGPIRPEVASATGLRPDVRVICGSHDSNASLIPYLVSRADPFIVVSTGTWAILMAVGGKGKLDPKADMLANVDVLGRPVPTARLMLGREFSILAGDAPADIAQSDVEALVAAKVMAMPAFSDQGGPFARRKGRIMGEAPTSPRARTALAALYCALMTTHVLHLLDAPGEVIVEGGFNRTPAFAALVAALSPGRATLIAAASGAAEGAAMLAHWGEPQEPPRLKPARAWKVEGLSEYRDRWEAALRE